MLEILAIILTLLFPVGMAWTDSVSTRNIGQLTLSVSDDGNNWLDATVGVSTGLIGVSDSIALTDDISLRAQGLLSAADDLNTWADSAVRAANGQASVSDSVDNWNETVVCVPGHAINPTDSISQSDDVSYRGQGLRTVGDDAAGFADGVATQLDILSSPITRTVTDANTLADFTPAISLSYRGIVSDDVNNWADAAVARVSIGLVVSDDAASWNDAVIIAVPMLSSASDSNTLTDFTPVTSLSYRGIIADSLSQSDTVIVRFGLIFSDNLAAWDDSVTTTVQAAIQASDNLNAWGDHVVTFPRAPLMVEAGEALAFDDFVPAVGFGYEVAIDDSFNLTDNATTGVGLAVSDSADNWNDAVTFNRSLAFAADDSLPGFVEQVSRLAQGQLAPSDLISLTDSVSLTSFLDVDDDAGYVDDDVETLLSSGSHLNSNVSDVLTQSDSINLQAAELLEAADSTSQADNINLFSSLSAAVGDSGANWQDDAQAQTAVSGSVIAISITDTLESFGDGVAYDGVFISGNTSVFSAPSGGNGWAAEETTNRWAA